MNILEEIVQSTREALEQRKKTVPLAAIRGKLQMPLSEPGFKAALSEPGMHLIAELKKASPSASLIRKDFDVPVLARSLAKAGASCLSVLTEEKYFQGHLNFLDEADKAVALPLLRKDFMVDEYQIYESKLHGADAILLIASLLTKEQLKKFSALAFSNRLDVLLEIHDETELDKALSVPDAVLGINTRNLKDFSIDLEVLPKLMSKIPQERLVICESGIKDRGDLALIKAAGAKGVLVGTSLMQAKDLGRKAEEFVNFLKNEG